MANSYVYVNGSWEEITRKQTTHIESFTTTGTHTWSNPGVSEVEVLVVGGGGGGGGSPHGAGGGAGGLIHKTSYPVSGDVTLTVGAGGAGGEGDNGDWDTSHGHNGEDSTFGDLTAIGGGGGGAYTSRISSDYGGRDGGSGGGATDESQPGSALQPATDGGYGHGSIHGRINEYSSGGGGAGEPGDADGDSQGGDGMDFSSTFGTQYGENGWFAGGGGGSVYSTTASGPNGRSLGGNGGGGNGGVEVSDGSGLNVGEDAMPNTGGGGGGSERDSSLSASSDAYGGDGGSGIVILKYVY
ncbi:hypothetical protein HrrHF2_520 [Halorubrum phage HF2]|uniref:Glycine-rich domain-containing protein n=1 Tax=Halorubrum phage HF2 TaxID=33771 RepID=Q8V6M2_9CAUD|nr:hypothetical protein HrrHF2_520 [Halorubrum phage HF2]AAL55001.2 hypothetical protein HrrHF2_520 [Halorubrum phage HF2]